MLALVKTERLPGSRVVREIFGIDKSDGSSVGRSDEGQRRVKRRRL
jgi:hypothetical protein